MPSEVPGRHSVDDSQPDRTDEDELRTDPHTRRALQHLHETDGPVDVETLATRVVADFRDQPPEDVPNNVSRRVQTWFHHGQLPALDDHGVVEYDSDEGVVSLADDETPDRSADAPRTRS